MIMVFPFVGFLNGATGHDGDIESSCRTVIKDTVRRHVHTTWSETYIRQDLFPSYLFYRRQFHAIAIFRLKSISDLNSRSLPRFFGEFIYAKLIIVVSKQRLDVKWPKLRSPVDRVRVRARVRLGLVSNSVSSAYLFYQYLGNMNIDRNMLFSYDMFILFSYDMFIHWLSCTGCFHLLYV